MNKMLLTRGSVASRRIVKPLYRCLAIQASNAIAANPVPWYNDGSKHTTTMAGAASVLLMAMVTAATVSQMESIPSTPKRSQNKSAEATQHTKEGTKVSAKRLADNNPPLRPDLPTIPLEEVSEHCTEDSMWYTFRGAVYDLTPFLEGHPGGAPRLLMAAGQDLEPYWEVYRQHLRGHVVEWMEKYRIGNLTEQDATTARNFKVGDMFLNDPVRHPDLLPATTKPFNGEPRIELLTRDYITPNELFYARCHLAVPDIKPDEYRLHVGGNGIRKKTYKLEDLKKKFPKHEVVTTLQCAGNRREDLHDKNHKIFIAPHWVIGAMSTAKWGGVRLRDVLEDCGLDVDAIALGRSPPPDGVEHVQLEGYDQDETGYTYGGSFPFLKAVDGLGEVILAYEMNGEDLPRDHGYPVRMIIPGHVGARQVKWLHKIRLSDVESKKSYQQKSYRGFVNSVTFEKDLAEWPPARLDQGPIIHEQPVTSFICNPPQNATLGAKGATDITLKGVAWSGGGRKIERVDVSVDGGKTWSVAELFKPIQQRYNRHWAWTQFYLTVPLPQEIQDKLQKGEKAQLDVTSKALDSAFNVQPETMDPYWNPRGIAINHWYHVKVELDPSKEKDSIIRNEPEEGFPNTPSGGNFDRVWGMGGWTVDPHHQEDPYKERNTKDGQSDP